MRSLGFTSFLLVALCAGASADIIAPASNASQMDDSAWWALLGSNGYVSSLNGVTVTLGGASAQDSGSTKVDFDTPVSGAGFVAQQANLADSGAFTISAWGVGNSLLGTESVAAGTRSAVLVGLLDNTGADIYSVSVNFSDTSNSSGSGNFAIDSLLLADTQTASGPGLITSNLGPLTPEPAAVFLCGSALVAFGLFRRRRIG
jgi:hypothetical protein